MSTQVSPKTMAAAVRALSMDAVQKAKSGHPGMPMGMADIAVALFTRHLRHNPLDPKWIGRDRFILSNGHGSMLQYAMLHLTGYDLTMDDIKNFRQLGSKTPGHPEVGVTPGVETTTGPLGQGIANAVGMALAEKMLAAEFNRDGFNVIDNRTYVFLGDGCMMEGISHEVCSLAGVWGLNKLIALYDDNGISIDGDIKGWFADDTRKRFEAYGWNVIGPINGHDVDAVDEAIAQAKTQQEKPTLIICRTVIGQGSPHRAGTRNTDMDLTIRLAGAVERAGHEGIILRRIAEDDQLGRTDAVALGGDLGRAANDGAHHRDGVHIDARLGRADIDAAANQIGLSQRFSN